MDAPVKFSALEVIAPRIGFDSNMKPPMRLPQT